MTELLQQFISVIHTFFPIALLTGAISFGLRSRTSPIGTAVWSATIDAALVYVGLVVGYLVFSPQPQSPSTLALIPGEDLLWALDTDPRDPLPWMELAGNGMLLLPLGALLPLRVRWLDSVLKVMLAALVTSCAIEFIQYVAIVGRTSSADDVILNTFGATLGGIFSRVLTDVALFTPVQGPRYQPRHALTRDKNPTARRRLSSAQGHTDRAVSRIGSRYRA